MRSLTSPTVTGAGLERLTRWDQLLVQLRVGGAQALVPMARGALGPRRARFGGDGAEFAPVAKRRGPSQRPAPGVEVEVRSDVPAADRPRLA